MVSETTDAQRSTGSSHPHLDLRTLADTEVAERIPLEDRVPHGTTYEAIAAAAAAHPERTAIRWLPLGYPSDQDTMITYEAFITGIHQTANLFWDLGVRRDDVVAYLLPNLPETHIVLAAAQSVGVVFPLNPLLGVEQLTTMASVTGVRLIVAARGGAFDAYAGKAGRIAAAIEDVRVVYVDTEGARPDGLHAQIARYRGDALDFEYDATPRLFSACMHTGGTTGVPKIMRGPSAGALG